MVEKVLAAVRTAPSKTEILEYPMPEIPIDGALMKMEVAGICGTDVKLYAHPPTKAPVIMGHENIGYIAKAGREFTRRKGFKEGDLVFVEHYVMCGKCEWCHRGEYRHCENTDCDEAAAAGSLFGGLAASGWHTAAITMRLLVRSGLPIAGGIIGAGGDISWPRPTRPGDVLSVESEIVATTPSRSRPDRGMVSVRSETKNQRGEIVQVLLAKLVVPRRVA